MKNNKICAVCHDEYSYCPNCKEHEDKPTWMFVFCSENCHDIYEVTSSYNEKEITEKEAKNKLDKLDLTKLNNFGESYKNTISKINEVTKVTKEKKVAKTTNKVKGDLVNDSIEDKEDGKVDVE